MLINFFLRSVSSVESRLSNRRTFDSLGETNNTPITQRAPNHSPQTFSSGYYDFFILVINFIYNFRTDFVDSNLISSNNENISNTSAANTKLQNSANLIDFLAAIDIKLLTTQNSKSIFFN